jgi:hypothetical protein
MIYSIDLFAQLLSRFGRAVQQQEILTPPQSRLSKVKLIQQNVQILRFPTHVKPVKKVKRIVIDWQET